MLLIAKEGAKNDIDIPKVSTFFLQISCKYTEISSKLGES